MPIIAALSCAKMGQILSAQRRSETCIHHAWGCDDETHAFAFTAEKERGEKRDRRFSQEGKFNTSQVKDGKMRPKDEACVEGGEEKRQISPQRRSTTTTTFF